MKRIKSDKIIANGKLFNGYLYIKDDKIAEVSTKEKSAEECYDFSGFYVSAGFIDMHTHGAGGYAFINSSIDDVVKGCDYHLNYGTTSIVPTISAGEFKTMETAVINIQSARGKAKGNILGAHLEGPYLSLKQAGAQCPSFITAPIKQDYQALVEKYGDSICIAFIAITGNKKQTKTYNTNNRQNSG